MTNDEALKILQDGILNGSDDTPEKNEAVEFAIKALEKQSLVFVDFCECGNMLWKGDNFCSWCGKDVRKESEKWV